MRERERKSEPEREPPLSVKLHPVSNGEFEPVPEPVAVTRAKRLARERAARTAQRLGIAQRAFLRSSCGVATVLLSLNETTGCTGGVYRLRPEAFYEEEATEAFLGGEEFIFDVQTHHVNPDRGWADDNLTVWLLATLAPWLRCVLGTMPRHRKAVRLASGRNPGAIIGSMQSIGGVKAAHRKAEPGGARA